MWYWLALALMVAIPFLLRLALLRRLKVRRWKANLAALTFLPALAFAGCIIVISGMTQEESTSGGMAMIFPLFVVGVPIATSLVAVGLAEFLERLS